MIRSFRCKETQGLFQRQGGKRFQEIERVAYRKLRMLDAAVDLRDLAGLGNQLEALKKERAGQHSIRISKKWRLCFRWHNGGAYDVEIVDYH